MGCCTETSGGLWKFGMVGLFGSHLSNADLASSCLKPWHTKHSTRGLRGLSGRLPVWLHVININKYTCILQLLYAIMTCFTFEHCMNLETLRRHGAFFRSFILATYCTAMRPSTQRPGGLYVCEFPVSIDIRDLTARSIGLPRHAHSISLYCELYLGMCIDIINNGVYDAFHQLHWSLLIVPKLRVGLFKNACHGNLRSPHVVVCWHAMHWGALHLMVAGKSKCQRM